MKLPSANQFRVSIFIKILIPLFVAMVLIHIIVATTVMPLLKPAMPHKGPPPNSLGRHPGPAGPPGPPHGLMEEVTKMVEAGKSPEEIKRVFDRGEEFSYEGSRKQWATAKDLPSWQQLKASPEVGLSESGELFGHFQGRPFFGKELTSGKLVMFAPPHGFRAMPSPLYFPPFWWMLSLQVIGVLILCYAILVWQLRPIKKLSEAMAQLSKGDLTHRISLNDSGEFGRLGDGFNDMAEKISTMIRDKEELMLGVSHELRSPLASINVLIELINDEKRRTQIRGHLNRIDSLVEELLESHRIASEHGRSRFAPVDLHEILNSLTTRYENVAPGFRFMLDGDVELEGDPRLIDRLLSNLIENGMKYSSESRQPVEVLVKTVSTGVCIEVVDCGPGIPTEDLSSIFEPFYRVDKSRNKATGGFGLGLYLCSKIVRLHRGEISVRNRPEGGCIFTVILPLTAIPTAITA